MPSNTVKSFAKRSGKSIETIERYWDEAQIVVKKQYSDAPVDSDRYYALVVGIVKRMLGIEDMKVEKLETKLDACMEELLIHEAFGVMVSNPFEERSGVMFVEEDAFRSIISRITEIDVEQIKRSEKNSYYILLDEESGGYIAELDSIQFIYGGYTRQYPIYITEWVKSGLYEMRFNSMVVIK